MSRQKYKQTRVKKKEEITVNTGNKSWTSSLHTDTAAGRGTGSEPSSAKRQTGVLQERMSDRKTDSSLNHPDQKFSKCESKQKTVLHFINVVSENLLKLLEVVYLLKYQNTFGCAKYLASFKIFRLKLNIQLQIQYLV